MEIRSHIRLPFIMKKGKGIMIFFVFTGEKKSWLFLCFANPNYFVLQNMVL